MLEKEGRLKYSTGAKCCFINIKSKKLLEKVRDATNFVKI